MDNCLAPNRLSRRCIVITACVLTLLVAGCAQAPVKDRDLNAEAMRQMSYWGGEPGF